MKIIESFMTKAPCYQNNLNAKKLYDRTGSDRDTRYWTFQQKGPQGLMLHSVGCSQPSAKSFADRWNKSTNDNVAVHAVIDANTGDIYQCLKWNYRGWHAGGTANNTHIGVEMCESNYISYINGYKFNITNKTKAQEHCRIAYNSAVELFAYLCKEYNIPVNKICSHKEGCAQGIASNHGDPEHYWKGLSMPYTMDGFRKDVQNKLNAMNTPAPAPTKKYYRIRKTWADKDSQIGAYENLELAKKNCPENYSVFDDSGKVVYTRVIESNISDLADFLKKMSEYRKTLQDNDSGSWSEKDRNWAIGKKLFSGSGTINGVPNYMWHDFLTREQAAVVLHRLYEIIMEDVAKLINGGK